MHLDFIAQPLRFTPTRPAPARHTGLAACSSLPTRMVLLALFSGLAAHQHSYASPPQAGEVRPEARIQVDHGHPWRPPFGLDRIGQPLHAIVEIPSDPQPSTEYSLIALLRGKEIARSALTITGQAPRTCRVSFDPWPTELVLIAKSAQGAAVELVRQSLQPVPFEADAVARPDKTIHPVDLGTVLVPSDWLLLAPAQTGSVEVAAIDRTGDSPRVLVGAWFDSSPEDKTQVEMALAKDRASRCTLQLPTAPTALDRDILHVSIEPATGSRIWHKTIQTMLVHRPPQWPKFGARETKLRYDAPISVRAEDGTWSAMSYAGAWDPKLQDVVVALPNGARFVFWRGSSYVPFWAGRHNTGLSYEWAETSPPADGYADCVEPLMDKELRYGRVQIIESTAARVHVRWSYQSCDFQYKTWGDSAAEDFYFYPDGFGTRVLTLHSAPSGDYELSEFILLTPQATYPLSVLPAHLVDVLFLDGQKHELTFPFFPHEQGDKVKSRNMPALYRLRLHQDEPLCAVYFCPLDLNLPPTIFAPFFDKGYLVTPTYWGSHWPLARGKTTGFAIDDRVQLTPCHNSVMSFARSRPQPLRTAQFDAIDARGQSRPMVVQTWVWLIGMSGADDARLLEWARSFSKPPSLEVQGARLENEPFAPERRAIRLIVEQPQVSITIKPIAPCVNPVFEFSGAPKTLARVQLDARVLQAQEYAWDGQTLWLDATLHGDTRLQVVFGAQSQP